MVSCSVQFQVMKTRVYQSFYSLSHAEEQMRSYVFDSLRAALSTLTLDQAFDCKDDISVNLKATLNTVFSDYGFQICQTLVTDISPNNRVKDAMNEINSSMRIKEASYQRAEGEKLLKVKRAEAEAESMHLSGVGVARSRHAIMDGLKESIQAFSEGVTGTTARDVMDLLILTQYFDALQEVGSHGTTRTIFLAGDSNPIRSGILEANSAQ
ncbi:HIRL2 [Symbiodinium microadriaticum]|nr:HIRL2 [Symbiodinium microadriaticum]